VIFRCPDGIVVNSSQAQTNPVLGPGVDIRARNGYAVTPPSRHISGRLYEWSVDHHPAHIPLADVPTWLVERLAERPGAAKAALDPSRVKNPTEHWRALTGGIREYRDAAAASVIGHLLRHYVDPHLAAGLLDAWNQQYCSPPLAEYELRQIINRIAKRELRRRGTNHAQ
jgi:hypothetical protein